MALHTELPIYRTGVRLLSLAVKVQEQMPRSIKRILGDKSTQHCVDLLDPMALANASQHEARAEYIGELLKRQRAVRRTLNVALGRLHDMPAADLHQSANSYFGLLRQASHSHHDRTLVANVARNRGHLVAGDITKIFRRA